MRGLIRKQLIDHIPEIGGRVFETDVAAADEEKPYLVMMKGTESDENDWAGTSNMIEVWPYLAHTQFKHVDSLVSAVIDALDHQLLTDSVTGEAILCRFTGSTSADMLDEKFDAITRGVQFEIFSLGWLLHEPVEPDPASALSAWAAERFPSMQTDPRSWNPSDESPALYWRMASILSVQTMSWGAWIDATVRGHMLVPNVSARNTWLDRTVRQLALEGQVTMLDQSRMMIRRVSADSSLDPFRVGQIALDVRFGILRPAIHAERLNHIHIGGA
ncbi:MAG: 3'-phosphoadenosine 5'-phosphosulfate sulfotransferase [Paenibacillus macerans]|uniref:3'-phosphoadenosine 5'-phosphosulfate sulfotransferase n=1 Tax=Paenibacillus macerans TaxID=44252 RepID=UPI001F0D1683|nr:3'-phosphoadenosine 5'-phosphosulfate sulfotransferase [Paenibacillus macerans]MDU7473622.1 3'-phosphoadenosine 5'-phosphosulfate sulfotransferase [Paenibacillus macerans]MEC0139206.1 3'-phosphoadenosine 5'-phosphosulfate sulfotransferase [Paenibacillus macerans]UMV47287.1 3'-phosphoadenosine 5'-phosphosulfate sulfotransferase [Paenibacillus macerans]